MIDISITPNRGDCFSIRGIAREIAVINQLEVNAPKIQCNCSNIADEKVVNISTEGTPFLGRIIKMSIPKRRHQNGWNRHWHVQASVSIVFWSDITNYVLIELVNRCMPLIWQKSKVRSVRQAQPQEN